jgi:hypothetical protein
MPVEIEDGGMGYEVGFLVVANIRLNDIFMFTCHVIGVCLGSKGYLVSQ